MTMSADRGGPMVVGQGALCVSDVARSARFYAALGLRAVLARPPIAVLELGHGTHLLLVQVRGEHAPRPSRSFGLLVEDAEEYRERVAAAGIDAGPVIEDASRHRVFEMTDPDGHVLKVMSAA
jgi:hypothetical protein